MHIIKISILLILLTMLVSCRKERANMFEKLAKNETLEQKLSNSSYDWKKMSKVKVCISSPEDGMISISAVNGEIIYSGYLLNGVLHEYVLNIPSEVSHVLVEHADYTKIFEVSSGKINHDFK